MEKIIEKIMGTLLLGLFVALIYVALDDLFYLLF